MIKYSLGMTTLSQKQLSRIQSIAEEASLPKIGFNRKFPKHVLRGPHQYGGYGDPSLYIIKGYKQLQFMIGHLRNKDDIGTMLKQELEYLQILAGIEQPVMQRGVQTTWIRWVEPTWITDIKLFLSSIDAGLEFTDIRHPQIQREGDVFIMDSAGDNMENIHIQQINR